ncbi:MAG: hypothetical protein MUP17_01035 [candidate division Zixibacteria bacterium]|nr:hypothetical protein [candidate division Zixibacteria bacterium]
MDKEKLKKLVEEFSRPRDEFDGKSYITRRREWFDKPMESIRPLLMKDKLNQLTIIDAKKIYDEMTVGGPRLYPKTYIDNGLEKIKISLKYLLHRDEPLAERFYNFVANPDSEYRLEGVGRAFASTGLFLLNHKNNGIWNGAVDGGLKKLGILVKRERGEHVGQTYIKVNAMLNDLRERCGFEDLSLVDEFVELIFHEKIGSEILKPSVPISVYEKKEETLESKEAKADEKTHIRIQYLLIKIGRMEGYDVWVANNDRGKEYNKERFNDLCLRELPHFAGPTVMRIAQSVDIIWFKKNTSKPIWFFEIEHTTPVYSGLLRLNDVIVDYPLEKATIVSSKAKKVQFEAQIERRTFTSTDLKDKCNFMEYEKIEKWFESLKTLKQIKQ